MLRFALVSGLLGFALGAGARGAPPDNPDPALRNWYESLREPRNGYPCCSIADCRTTRARRGPRGWEVLVDQRFRASTEFWIPVPPEKTLTIENPTGQAVACYLPEAGLICFVPAPES